MLKTQVFTVVSLTAILGLTACVRGPETPGERDARYRYAREVLEETSPRNLNQHPKVTPEFITNYSSRSGCAQCPPEQIEVD